MTIPRNRAVRDDKLCQPIYVVLRRRSSWGPATRRQLEAWLMDTRPARPPNTPVPKLEPRHRCSAWPIRRGGWGRQWSPEVRAFLQVPGTWVATAFRPGAAATEPAASESKSPNEARRRWQSVGSG